MMHGLYMRIILITIIIGVMLVGAHLLVGRLVSAYSAQVIKLIGGRGWSCVCNIVAASCPLEKPI
jgi:hypothetical protein